MSILKWVLHALGSSPCSLSEEASSKLRSIFRVELILNKGLGQPWTLKCRQEPRRSSLPLASLLKCTPCIGAFPFNLQSPDTHEMLVIRPAKTMTTMTCKSSLSVFRMTVNLEFTVRSLQSILDKLKLDPRNQPNELTESSHSGLILV